MGRGSVEEVSIFEEVQRTGLDSFFEDDDPIALPPKPTSRRPLCKAQMHQESDSIDDHVSMTIRIISPISVAKQNEPADVCEGCGIELMRIYMGNDWSVSFDPIPEPDPPTKPWSPTTWQVESVDGTRKHFNNRNVAEKYMNHLAKQNIFSKLYSSS
jgi:hypothetical protein